jgi:hypothetical protein
MGFPVAPDSAFNGTADAWSWIITHAWDELLPGSLPDLAGEQAIIQSNGYGVDGYYAALKNRAAYYGGQTNAQRLVVALKNQGTILNELAALKLAIDALPKT